MKLAPIILSIILASSTVGYGLASAQMAGAGGGTPCSASYPCTKICGDHPCKPGEVYTAGGQNATKTNSTMSKSANSTGIPAMTTQIGISANVTATKITNGTMTNKMENGTMTGMNRTMTNGMVNEMGHTATVPPPAPTPSPAKQVASGTAPANVKCALGYYLMLNKFDSRPACVSQSVMSMLEQRGWGQAAP